MDAFFVNVHILDHPEDAGIPLAVGGRPGQRGVIASASYEARKFGVRSAMPSSTAVRLCPQLKIVGRTWSRISDVSRQVMGILGEYGPVEKMSVDEAYVDLTGSPNPEELARSIRRRVKADTGLPASVGLAANKLVAKIASDYDKPEGCKIVRPGKEASFMGPLPVRVIWGIGPRTAERLEKELKIETCKQLAEADLSRLEEHFGAHAKSLKDRAKGKDERAIVTERGLPKSISQEWTFSQDVDDSEELIAHLQKMSASVAKSLQKRNLLAHTVRVKFRLADFTTFTRQRSVEVGTDDEGKIFRLAERIWSEHWRKIESPRRQPMRLIGVAVSNLKEGTERQIDFGF